MAIFDHVRLRSDVLDKKYDVLLAPELHYLSKGDQGARIYSDSKEFFERTLVTRNALSVVDGVVAGILGEGPRIHVLYSFFGGGKTHTLLMIYHALHDREAFWMACEESSRLMDPLEAPGYLEEARRVYDRLGRIGPVEIIVITGKESRMFPDPENPQVVNGVEVKTLWGYIAASLGRYEMMSSFDETADVPTVGDLERLFKGVKVVIFIDEYVERVAELIRSTSSVKKNYGRNLISFIDNLASATTQSNATVVLTFPGEIRGDKVRFEDRYADLIPIINSIVKAVRRISSQVIEPVDPGDIWKVLKRRLFEYVDEEYAARIDRDLRDTYNEYSEIFGSVREEYLRIIRLSYPFHPGYLEVLRLIIERNAYLGRTRDALKISRLVLRELYERYRQGDLVEDLVMPWHLDPNRLKHERDVSILTGYEAFKIVAERDLAENCRKLREMGDLCTVVSASIFLRTYTVSVTGLSREVTRLFPTLHDIAVDVYEPGFFSARGLLPADIPEVLEQLPQTLHYLWTDGERYWFFVVPNYNEVVEREARELIMSRREELLEELTDRGDVDVSLRNLVLKSVTIDGGGRTRKYRLSGIHKPSVLRGSPIILKEAGLQDVPEVKDYTLVVAWRTVGVGFEDIVRYTIKAGRKVPRTYANTVVILAPKGETEDKAISLYAKIKAVNKLLARLSNEGLKLKDIDRDMSKILNNIQKTLLENIRDVAIANLIETLLEGFDIVYYPSNSQTSSGVKTIEASRYSSVTVTNLVEKVEGALASVFKIVKDIDEDKLLDLFNSTIKDLAGLDDYMTVSQILSYFKIKSSAPMIHDETLKKSLKKAYNNRLIIVRKEDKSLAYWGLEIGGCSGKGMDLEITPEDQVILSTSPKAVEDLINYLKNMVGEERLRDGTVRIRIPKVYRSGQELSLDQLLEEAKRNPLVMTDSTLRICLEEIVRRPGIRLEAPLTIIDVPQGGEVRIDLRIKLVGDINVKQARISLEPDQGLIAEYRSIDIDLDRENTTHITVKGEVPGEHRILVKAKPIEPPGEGDSLELIIRVASKTQKLDCRELARSRVKVKEIEVQGPFEGVIDVLRGIEDMMPNSMATARAIQEDTGIELAIGRENPLQVVEALIDDLAKRIREYTESTKPLEARIKIIPTEPVDSQSLEKILPLILPGVECSITGEVLGSDH